MEFEPSRDRAAEVVANYPRKALLCGIPSLISDAYACQHKNRLLCISQISLGTAGLVQVIEVHWNKLS